MSAPASTQACARSIADCIPSTASASVRAMITKLSSLRASTAALMRSAISPWLTMALFAPMPAALLHHLVFDMKSRRTGLRDLARGARDVEGAAPAGVDVHQQRQVTRCSDAACILAYVMQRRDAEIGNAE